MFMICNTCRDISDPNGSKRRALISVDAETKPEYSVITTAVNAQASCVATSSASLYMTERNNWVLVFYNVEFEMCSLSIERW